MIPRHVSGFVIAAGRHDAAASEELETIPPHFNQSPTFPIIPIIPALATHPGTGGGGGGGRVQLIPADGRGGPAAERSENGGRTCANANSNYC